MRFVVFFCLAFLFMNQCVFAAYCNRDDYSRVESLANEISIEYSFRDELETKGIFDIIITGIPADLFIKDEEHNIVVTYDNTDEGTYIIEGVTSDKYTFNVIYEKCDFKIIKTINVSLPKYNSLADSSECDNISGDELKVCDEWYQGDLDEETFYQKIDEYNNNLKKEEQQESYEKIISFFKENIIYMISAILVVVTVIIIVIYRKRRNSLD